jgi:hypothetical protein
MPAILCDGRAHHTVAAGRHIVLMLHRHHQAKADDAIKTAAPLACFLFNTALTHIKPPSINIR